MKRLEDITADNATPQDMGRLIKAKMHELTEGLSIEKLASIDYMQLNREAIKLVQEDLKRKAEA